MLTKQISVLFALFLIIVRPDRVRSDKACRAIRPDAITQTQNGSIVILQSNDVWIVHKASNELYGPCPIDQVFDGMNGPIDAAVTFLTHTENTDFIGVSLFFGQGKFWTFKNMKAFQIEWGGITFIPFQGQQTQLASLSDADSETKALIAQKMIAAYFDPIENRVTFILYSGKTLGFDFGYVGYQYDEPMVSTLDNELKKYGISDLPNDMTAALTVSEKRKSRLYLFFGSKYCVVHFNLKKTNQNCVLKPISEFLGCSTLVRKVGYCELRNQRVPGHKPKGEIPIQVTLGKPAVNVEPEIKPTVRRRNSLTTSPKPTNNNTNSNANNGFSYCISCKLILFLFIFSFI